MDRNLQAVVTSAIAVTLFALLVYPAIINLDGRPLVKSQYDFLFQVLVIAIAAAMVTIIALSNRVSVWVSHPAIKEISDPQALSCIRRC